MIESFVPITNKRQQHRAAFIRNLIRLTSRYTPWNSNCFPQAIIARCLLAIFRVPYAMYFGLQKGQHPNELKAHAWVVSGRVVVCGGCSFQQYTVVACYASQDLSN